MTNMKQIQFFATREDLLLVLENVERDTTLRYVRTGNQLNPYFETFQRGRDIPNLGVADRETGSVCGTFLVAKAATSITAKNLRGSSGVQRFVVDQLLNPDTVALTPAGRWGEDLVLNGRLATASNAAVSQELMKRFSSAFRKHFRRIGAYWVGPQSVALLAAGKRLTISAQSPPDFDLVSRPSEL